MSRCDRLSENISERPVKQQDRQGRMNRKYTNSELARSVGVPTTTLRYYERIGLLEPEDRSQGNYRLYSGESLPRKRGHPVRTFNL
jgi:hypothetical protein